MNLVLFRKKKVFLLAFLHLIERFEQNRGKSLGSVITFHTLMNFQLVLAGLSTVVY